MNYQWDPKKAASNLKKHGVDFADAVSVLEDQWALTLEKQLVNNEERSVTIGMDIFARVLVIVYTYRNDDLRIISARKATRKERKVYERKRRI